MGLLIRCLELFVKFSARTYFTALLAIFVSTDNADRTSSYGTKSSTRPHAGRRMCGMGWWLEGRDRMRSCRRGALEPGDHRRPTAIAAAAIRGVGDAKGICLALMGAGITSS